MCEAQSGSRCPRPQVGAAWTQGTVGAHLSPGGPGGGRLSALVNPVSVRETRVVLLLVIRALGRPVSCRGAGPPSPQNVARLLPFQPPGFCVRLGGHRASGSASEHSRPGGSDLSVHHTETTDDM